MSITAEELKYFVKNFLKKIIIHTDHYPEIARLTIDPKLYQIAEKLSKMNGHDMVYINKIIKIAIGKELVIWLSVNSGPYSQWFSVWIRRLINSMTDIKHIPYLQKHLDQAVEIIRNE